MNKLEPETLLEIYDLIYDKTFQKKLKWKEGSSSMFETSINNARISFVKGTDLYYFYAYDIETGKELMGFRIPKENEHFSKTKDLYEEIYNQIFNIGEKVNTLIDGLKKL